MNLTMADSDPIDSPVEPSTAARWQVTTLLLALVTSLNNDGHSTLVPPDGGGSNSLRSQLVDDPTGEREMRNAVTTLLVRNCENVALTSLPSSVDHDKMIQGELADNRPSKFLVFSNSEKVSAKIA